MSYILFIDTSGDVCTIALAKDDHLIDEEKSIEARNHAASINTMIGTVLDRASVAMKELSCVVVCAGPGSYTGLRIGMSTAKGICYALNIPLILQNKLDILANKARVSTRGQYENYVAILTARDKEYFIAIGDGLGKNTLSPIHIPEEDLSAYTDQIGGNTYVICDQLPEAIAKKIEKKDNISFDTQITTNFWVKYAYEEFKCNRTVNLSTAEPFYLKQVYTHNSN